MSHSRDACADSLVSYLLFFCGFQDPAAFLSWLGTLAIMLVDKLVGATGRFRESDLSSFRPFVPGRNDISLISIPMKSQTNFAGFPVNFEQNWHVGNECLKKKKKWRKLLIMLWVGEKGKIRRLVARQHPSSSWFGTLTVEIICFVLICVSLAAENPRAAQITPCMTPQSQCWFVVS